MDPSPGDRRRQLELLEPSPRTSTDVSLVDNDDGSHSAAGDVSRSAAADASRRCAWCRGGIPTTARRDAKFCGQRCRQASHRFGRGMLRAVAAGEPLRVAYADPPYPGKAHLYRGHPDYAGEVDHRALVDELVAGFPDGWALSTSAEALPEVLALCPPGVRVAAWVRGERPNQGALVALSSWEPVIFHGGRAKPSPVDARRVDSLVYRPGTRTTDPDRVIGAKPATFIWWLFELLGLEPHDELVDLFPGSGGVGRAWSMFTDPSRLQEADDPSPGPQLDLSLDVEHDLSVPPAIDVSPSTVVDVSQPGRRDVSRLEAGDLSVAARGDGSAVTSGSARRVLPGTASGPPAFGDPLALGYADADEATRAPSSLIADHGGAAGACPGE